MGYQVKEMLDKMVIARVTPSMRLSLETLAIVERRDLSQLVRCAVEDYVKRKGPLTPRRPPDPDGYRSH